MSEEGETELETYTIQVRKVWQVASVVGEPFKRELNWIARCKELRIQMTVDDFPGGREIAIDGLLDEVSRAVRRG